jgi:hypothetical protein
MKRLIPFVLAMSMAAKLLALDGTVTVNTNTHVVVWPLDFFSVNGITTTADTNTLYKMIQTNITNIASLQARAGTNDVAGLTTNTQFSGMVTGKYNNLQLMNGAVTLDHVNTASLDTRYLTFETNTFKRINVKDETYVDAEMVSNGAFTNSTQWASSGVTFNNSRVELGSGGTGQVAPSNALAISVGKTYLVSLQKGSGWATNIVMLGGDTWTTTNSGFVSNVMYCSSSATNLVVKFQTTGAASDWFDDLSIKAVTNGDVRAAGVGYFGGSVYAPDYYGGNFHGNAGFLTGLVSAVTAGVNQITVGSSNIIGNINLVGSLVTASGGSITTITVSRAEYLSFQITAPTNNYYEKTWAMPRQETGTLSEVWAQTDHDTCTFSVVYAPYNVNYATCYTNLYNVNATPTGNWYSSGWTYGGLPASNKIGVKVLTVGATCTNLSVGVRLTY